MAFVPTTVPLMMQRLSSFFGVPQDVRPDPKLNRFASQRGARKDDILSGHLHVRRN